MAQSNELPMSSGGGTIAVPGPRDPAYAVAAGCVLSYFLGLALLFRAHGWILDAHGKPVVADFLEVWVAGRTVLQGAAASVYDPDMHHAAQAVVIGHDFKGFLGWHYPPQFLFVAALLALLPYGIAFLVWVSVTLAAYATTIAAIVRSRAGALFACAAPATFADIMSGQNGFLTASLIGAALLSLETRPVLCGICLGLLTYKPQFGILFPLALLASRQWRALAAATCTAAFVMLTSWFAFGSASFEGFVHYLPLMSKAVLVEGSSGWGKLQSVYSVARWLGANNMSAWAAQLSIAVGSACAIGILWSGNASSNLKAAALSGATLLATPYLYLYDLPLLIVPIAFLRRDRAFDTFESVCVAAANLFIAAFVVDQMPVGPPAAALVAFMIVRRILQDASKISAIPAAGIS